MLVATFGPSTGWAGKTITREGDAFMLEGHGPITAADVMEYDRQGQLVWANDGTRAWVGSRAKVPAAPMPGPGTAGVAPSTAGASAQTSSVARPESTGLPVSRRLLGVIGASLAIVIVVVALALTGVLGGEEETGSSKENSWPQRLAGTWLSSDGSAQETVVIGSDDNQATLTHVHPDGGNFTYTFYGDTLTANWSATPDATVFERQTPAPGPYLGIYGSDDTGTCQAE